MGHIVKTFQGANALVRNVLVETKTGLIQRLVVELCLPMESAGWMEEGRDFPASTMDFRYPDMIMNFDETDGHHQASQWTWLVD